MRGEIFISLTCVQRRWPLPISPKLDEIHALPRNTLLVFLCHHGNRSQAAAEQFRPLGFSALHNVVGGIDAWSRDVDPRIPVY